MAAETRRTDWEQDCVKYRGEVLTGRGQHWCFEFDELPTDDTCAEWPCCDLAYGFLPRKIKKWAKQGWPRRRNERLVRRYHRAAPAWFRRHDPVSVQKIVELLNG